MADSREHYIAVGEDNAIDSVLLMTNQALVNRIATLQVGEGMMKVRIATQAAGIDAGSVQAQVKGAGEVVGVQFVKQPVQQFVQPQLQELEQEKKQLQRQRKQFEQKKLLVEKQKRLFDSVSKFSDVQVPAEIQTHLPEIDKLQALGSFLEENFSVLLERQMELENQMEDLDQQLRVIDRKLKDKRSGTQKSQEVIEVLFQSSSQQTLEIHCDYLVGKALWQPVYKVNVSDDCKQVQLTMFASIRQNTGETWNNIQLKVSNAIPLRGAALPKLNSWFLRPRPEPMPIPVAPAAMAEPLMGAAGDAGFEENEAVLEDLDLGIEEEDGDFSDYAVADTRKTPLALEYELPIRVDIPSGNEESLTPVFSRPVEGEFFHYSVPRRDRFVYLICNAQDQQNLLAGRMNVYFGGRFIGSTLLEEKQAGEEFWLNLGVDREVIVKHKKTVDRNAETFFGMVDRSSVAKELEFVTDIENGKAEAVTLMIEDHVPVSKTDRFQVKGLQMSPPPDQEDCHDKAGVHRWKLQLAPMSERQIRVLFSVKYPKDVVVEGL